jgi:prepilin-type N-terminal cleavage/methylation domain-containing protein
MLNKLNKKGFTMVELLVVLVIVAILAAVATPIYLANTKRSKMSEAIATMGLIRQAERDYKVNHGFYFDIAEVTTQALTAGNIKNGLPNSVVADGTPTPATAGVDVNVGTSQYFSNAAFFVDAHNTTPTSITSVRTVATGLFTNPPPVDFIISARGANSFPCGTVSPAAAESCAVKATEVNGASATTDYEAVMDNSGRIYVCYGTDCSAAANWSAY